MSREEQIKNFMEKLQISYEEAEQLLEDDEEDYIGEEGEAMTEKAKAIKTYVGGEKKERKPREKKVDNEKAEIIKIIEKALKENGYSAKITNVDKTIDFGCYTVNLVKHRPPKK